MKKDLMIMSCKFPQAYPAFKNNISENAHASSHVMLSVNSNFLTFSVFHHYVIAIDFYPSNNDVQKAQETEMHSS